jgi:two-component system response regulator RstA
VNPDVPLSVLLIEDDEKIARLTAEYLERRGVAVRWVANGNRGVRTALSESFDAVVLDLMLPGMDGLDVCRELRRHSHVPIIAVTARVEVEDRVLGLETGVDDYLSKPFSARELLARIHAQVRRSRGLAGPTSTSLQVGELVIDTATLSVSLAGRPIVLTAYEFALLRVMAEHAGRPLSREKLLDLAKGNAEEAFDRSIDVRISRLRQKLGDDPKNPRLLKTIRGSGYVLVPAESR